MWLTKFPKFHSQFHIIMGSLKKYDISAVGMTDSEFPDEKLYFFLKTVSILSESNLQEGE